MAAGVDNRSSAMATTTGASGDAMAIPERAVARETPHCRAATETLLTRSGRSASCCESISLADLAKSLDRHAADRPSGRDGNLVALRFIRASSQRHSARRRAMNSCKTHRQGPRAFELGPDLFYLLSDSKYLMTLRRLKVEARTRLHNLFYFSKPIQLNEINTAQFCSLWRVEGSIDRYLHRNEDLTTSITCLYP